MFGLRVFATGGKARAARYSGVKTGRTIVQAFILTGALTAVASLLFTGVAHAPRPDLAHLFINFMFDGRNSADLTNLIGSGNPNLAAAQYIKPELKALPAVFPPKDVAARLVQLKEITAAQRRLRNRLWTEIKAAR